jgi:hypothetical protein
MFNVELHPIYTKATYLSDKTLKCPVPKLSRPDTVDVEISLNGHDWTHDQVKYSYYDAFVLDIHPKIGRMEGGTEVSILGYGFADTGDELRVRLGSDDEPLQCSTSPNCEFPATYVNDREIRFSTPPATTITCQYSGRCINTDPIDVEVSLYNHAYTNNHIKFQYILEPEYTHLDHPVGGANGGAYLNAIANF